MSKTVVLQKKVPNFQAPLTSEKTFKLKDYQGKKLVLYFYPKDNTPGCSQESDEFSQLYSEFKAMNTEIIGISRDSLKSHEKFKAKFEMPFELLSDEDEAVCQLFDVIKEKNMYGKKYMGIERSTFLIDEKGVLVEEWRKVKVKNHVDAVLAAVSAVDA